MTRRRSDATFDVVTYGEILWDVFARGKPGGARDRARLVGEDYVRRLGGAPANVAVTLARLGIRTSFVGGVGRDRFGRDLAAHLEADGVDTTNLVWREERTGVTFIARDAEGEPSFLFYRHESADVSLTAADVRARPVHAAWVLVGTSTLMTKALAAGTEAFLRGAVRRGARVVVDVNARPHLWKGTKALRDATKRLVRGVAWVKASDADLRALGVSPAWMVDASEGAIVVVTRGGGPTSVFTGKGEVRVTPTRTKVVDATGAGDAFVAGVLACLVSSEVAPSSPTFRDPVFWRDVLPFAHGLSKRAVSAVGSVTALDGLARERKLLHSLAREHRSTHPMPRDPVPSGRARHRNRLG
ncbi:MAG: carbohydrate kinase [Polyangiaceae bacterium]